MLSTTWRDDYYKKAVRPRVGVRRKGIRTKRVDYAALGGRSFLGNPKRPTFSVYQLIDEEYQVTQFQGKDRIISSTFPALDLTAEQLF